MSEVKNVFWSLLQYFTFSISDSAESKRKRGAESKKRNQLFTEWSSVSNQGICLHIHTQNLYIFVSNCFKPFISGERCSIWALSGNPCGSERCQGSKPTGSGCTNQHWREQQRSVLFKNHTLHRPGEISTRVFILFIDSIYLTDKHANKSAGGAPSSLTRYALNFRENMINSRRW